MMREISDKSEFLIAGFILPLRVARYEFIVSQRSTHNAKQFEHFHC